MTPLDTLCTLPFHDAGDALRARVLQRLADTELFAALARDPKGDMIELSQYDLPDGPVALAFDTEDRLSEFGGGVMPYAAMPGRALAAMVAQQGVGLLVNPGAPSEMLLDPARLDWLLTQLSHRPDESMGRAEELLAPDPEVIAVLAGPLGDRLADMPELVSGAAIVGASWSRTDADRRGHLIALQGVAPEHRRAVAKAIGELVAFLPPMDGPIDVTFEDRAMPGFALQIRLDAVAQTAPSPKPDRPPNLR